jgi:hypothetical protein
MKEHEPKNSVVDPDPNFHIGTDPDPDPDWNQNDADPHADPTQVLHILEYGIKNLLFILGMPVHNDQLHAYMADWIGYRISHQIGK